MDLTKEYPRSVRDKFAGVVMLGRATDKGRAFAAGTHGEYNYNCPMDQAVFGFLGIDKDVYLQKIKEGKSDAQLEEYARQFTAKKTQAEIDGFNQTFLQSAPHAGSDAEKYFLDLRTSLDPGRTDITTWPDLLDLDEKRSVPERAAV